MASVGCGAALGGSSVYSLSFADLLLATVIIIRGGRGMAGMAPFRGLIGELDSGRIVRFYAAA